MFEAFDAACGNPARILSRGNGIFAPKSDAPGAEPIRRANPSVANTRIEI